MKLPDQMRTASVASTMPVKIFLFVRGKMAELLNGYLLNVDLYNNLAIQQ